MEHTLTAADSVIALRPLSAEDSERYRLLRNQDRNRVCFFYSEIITPEAQRKWYRQYLTATDDYMFSVYDKEERFLGGAALYHIEAGSAEFGRLLIDRDANGKGTGLRVLSLLCGLAAQRFGLSLLHLEVYEDNLPARKTYEKAGFTVQKRYPFPGTDRCLLYMEKDLT